MCDAYPPHAEEVLASFDGNLGNEWFPIASRGPRKLSEVGKNIAFGNNRLHSSVGCI
jgi:hypothetical protein